MIEEISYNKKIFGYILKYKKKFGVNFLTPKKVEPSSWFYKT